MQAVSTSRIVMLATALLALSACTGIRVKTDTNAAASLSVCKSYGWLDPEVPVPRGPRAAFNNPVNDQRLRTAVAQRLASRGVQQLTGAGNPECLVAHAMGVRRDPRGGTGPRFSVGVGTGFGGYRSRTSAAIGVSSADYYDYREGRISVDIFRASNHEPLWHAEANVDVSSLRGADAEKKISEAVTAMFARYPG